MDGELSLAPAYAASIHKSQGSEYPAAVIPVMTQLYAMLQRNLLYTGVTRGKRAGRSGGAGEKEGCRYCCAQCLEGRRRWSETARVVASRPTGHEARCHDRWTTVAEDFLQDLVVREVSRSGGLLIVCFSGARLDRTEPQNVLIAPHRRSESVGALGPPSPPL